MTTETRMSGSRKYELQDFVDWAARSAGSKIESIVSFPLPFFRDSILVCLADELSDSSVISEKLFARVPNDLELFCLRRSEIYQLALPNPWEPQTLPLPFWIRHAGVVLYGNDIRTTVPVHRDYRHIFTSYLEITTHRVRNHFILELLLRKEYETLQRGLERQRCILMMVALLARGIWQVRPGTVHDQFLETYPGEAFRANAAAAHGVRAGISHPETRQQELAYRSVWLFECFLRELWKECK
jgi:hypothetical protein